MSMSMGSRIKELRLKAGLTQKDIADRLGMGSSNFGHIENDRVTPTSKDLETIADILETTTDYLLGRTSISAIPLTPKEEKDIAKDLERMLSNLESKDGLAFMGEPMDDETKELMRISLENSMRLAKQLAKKKFTPKKYK